MRLTILFTSSSGYPFSSSETSDLRKSLINTVCISITANTSVLFHTLAGK
ncbi:hypothetical protein HOF65_05805 [bacterium]|nr:hypothetical protein [bacterium]MBT5491679.1 hypothetical protein [bacterium]MBT6778943.1 hypothetical protein [bacterium]